MRLDKFLKLSRLIKRRTVANEACDAGRVSLNGKVARASAEVKAGDIIEIQFGNKVTTAKVKLVKDVVRKEEADLMIDAYTWQAHGAINGLATALNNQECELDILTQFGFSDSGLEKKELGDIDTESALYYMNEYSVIVTDTETGTILAIGKQK